MEQTEASSLSSAPNPSSTPPPSQASEPSSSQPPLPHLPPSSTSSASSIAATATSIHYQSPNSKIPAPPLQQQQSLSSSPQTLRPSSTLNRPWQHSHFSQFSSSSPSSPSGALSALSSPGSSSTPAPLPVQRGGVATGVPVHNPSNSSSSSQPAPFASSYGQHFGGLGRGSVNVTETASHSNTPQVRSHIQGNQAAGMFGSIASNSQMRAGGMPVQNQPRPVQSSLRPSSAPYSQPSSSQSFQGHSLLRVPSVGSPGASSPNTPQGLQSSNQPWLATSAQGKPPLPPPSYRQQVNSPSLPQRSHIPQPQQHSMPTVSQPQQMPSPQQLQSSQLHQTQDHFGQQFQPSRGPLASTQQQGSRVLASGIQKSSSIATPPSNIPPSVPQNRPVAAEADETCNRILSKRSIHELVSQINPSEKMDPEVEDILVDLADEFVDSITTFGCSLAKHRKSTTLEAKDILLHLERNWNMTLPGFGSDEIKIYKKTHTRDIHKDRLAAIKKSIASNEAANTKHSGGQSTGNTKGSMAKFSGNVIGSKH